jgi:hypothetical protein
VRESAKIVKKISRLNVHDMQPKYQVINWLIDILSHSISRNNILFFVIVHSLYNRLLKVIYVGAMYLSKVLV